MNCIICQKQVKNYIALGQHIKIHNIDSMQYYMLLFPNSGFCKVCNNATSFISISKGFRTTCCPKCAAIYSTDKRIQTNLIKYGVKNPTQNSDIKNKIRNTVLSEECQNRTKQTNIEKFGVESFSQTKEFKNIQRKINVKQSHITRAIESELFEKDHNCTLVKKLTQIYGQGWLSIKNNLHILKNSGYVYVDNNDIHFIIEYFESTEKSKPQKELSEFIQSIYNKEIIYNSKSIIKPYELDIYLPELNLAIEYNGNYWHSIESGLDKDYHLNKSLLCREKGIRLIHIYEFENFEQQKQLLKDLILGHDNYNPNDFNKNNFLDVIPELYANNTNKGTVYSIGLCYI